MFVYLAEKMMPLLVHRMKNTAPWKENFYFPSPQAIGFSSDFPFMASSFCVADDFFHTDFARYCEFIGVDVHLYRKLWEWVFIVHQAHQAGVLGPGRRGLAFGVGQELLPAAFANVGCEITATDAPLAVGVENGWMESRQFAAGLAGLPSGRMDRAAFESLVRWQECDMRAIDPTLTDYDFCWSSCCLEHLGDLQNGLDFIVESVEKTLKIGGVAFHTTEFNLSSNTGTVDHGATVLYRRCDFEALIVRLRNRGHQVDDLRLSRNAFVMNGYVDTPPYRPHLMLNFEGYAATSIGLVVRRGR